MEPDVFLKKTHFLCFLPEGDINNNVMYAN